MMRRFALVLALASSAACSRELSVPPQTLVLTVQSLGPNPAKAGDVVVAQYDLSADVVRCETNLGPMSTACVLVPPRTCRCSVRIPTSLAESVYSADLSAGSTAGTTRASVPLAIDQDPPIISAGQITFTQRPASWTVAATPWAIFDAISSTASVRLFGSAIDPTPLGTLALAPDGSIAPQTFIGMPPAELWVEAEDALGHVARARAVTVEVTAGLAGRVRYRSTGVHLAPYFFDADYDPTTAWPGVGVLTAGEAAEIVAAGGAQVGDLVQAVTTAVAETANVTAPAWAPMTTSGYPPSNGMAFYASWNAGVHLSQWFQTAYDPARRRTVVFSEFTPWSCWGTVLCPLDVVNPPVLWEFDGGTWTSTLAPGPFPRLGGAFTFDPSRGRFVLFGGLIDSGDTLLAGDTWEWDGQSWTSVATPHRPDPRVFGKLTYDAARNRVLLYGGDGVQSNCDGGAQSFCTATWAYDGHDWTLLTTDGPPITSLLPAGLSYVPDNGSLMFFGGWSGTLAGGYSWTSVPVNAFDGAWHTRGTTTTCSCAAAGSCSSSDGLVYDIARRVMQITGTGSGSQVWEFARPPDYPLDGGRHPGADVSIAAAEAPSHWPLFYDAGRRLTYAFGAGGGTDLYVLDSRKAHARTATQSFALDVPRGAILSSISVSYVGSGAGASGNGLLLHAWNWMTKSWDLVGSHSAAAGAPTPARTISTALPGAPADYLEAGGTRIWLMVSAPPSDLAGSVLSQVSTDFIEVRASYTLP